MVNEYCTCGAKLPEDARFCHKCGKPQRDEPEIEALAQQVAPAPEPMPLPDAAPAQAPGVSFRNPIAVRAAVISAALATLGGLIPLPGLFHTLWQLIMIVGGGFVAVWFYQRRTGDYLSIRGGLQIGWMTGLFAFVVMMVMLTLVFTLFAAVGENGIKQLSIESGRPEIAEAFQGIISNPAMLVFALVSWFFAVTMLASAGGALGSKVLEKE
jgi:hypothetical protein